MRRPPARRPRLLAGALIALAACGDDGPATRDSGAVAVAVAAMPCDRPTRDLGAGVVVAAGLVATAAHVVDGPRREVTVDGRPARVVAADARTDLALLMADVDGPPAALADAAPPDATVRNPAGDIPVTVLRAITLVVNDTTNGERHERSVLTISPSVPEGTSGAPVVDEAGRVLGIVVLDNRTDGTAYAVTSAELRTVLAADRIPGPRCPE